jgi:fructose-1-phosphate kinase PfkB-like protein
MVYPPVVKEKNQIGAGDSMVGGLVWALAQNIHWTGPAWGGQRRDTAS